MSPFLPEHTAYALLARAGLMPPRHGMLGDATLPFVPGEAIVLKGLGDGLWHKSELGCVKFLAFEAERVAQEAAVMRERVTAASHAWLGGLVCERVAIQRTRDLPSEAFVSLTRTDAGWIVLCGFGGLQANALAELAPPCRWPVEVVTPERARLEFADHLLGRIWRGALRDTHALTTDEDLAAFFAALWRLAALAEAEGLDLLELNPVALDPAGRPRPLDAVGRRASTPAPRTAPPAGFLDALRTPRRIALAGVSSQPDTVGRTILDNLRRYGLPPGDLVIIKRLDPAAPTPLSGKRELSAAAGEAPDSPEPRSGKRELFAAAGAPPDSLDSGSRKRELLVPGDAPAPSASGATASLVASPTFLGLPCVPDVSALRAAPVDLLVLALPAPAAAATLEALIDQGGGATAVALVAGGLGDGADTTGLGHRLQATLRTARAEGRWTPAVLGPNFLGHWVPATGLDSSFIPVDKLAAPATLGGELTLLSQSGAFLLCRRSRQPDLRFGLGLALGNQLDVALADVLAALASEPQPGPVACYVEGFGPGQLAPFAAAARALSVRGGRVLLHRAGRTQAGQAAAASHTGAMAGDLALERALLARSGVRFSDTLAEFDAALAWLAAYPRLAAGPVALLSNAGFESVNGSDLCGPDLPAAALAEPARAALTALLARHGLAGLVAPRLPLDLTPMAAEEAYLESADLLLAHAAVLVVGLVPFTRRLGTDGEPARAFAARLADLARVHGKPVGVAVDVGPDYEAYRRAFATAGLPTFDRVESALQGLRVVGS